MVRISLAFARCLPSILAIFALSSCAWQRDNISTRGYAALSATAKAVDAATTSLLSLDDDYQKKIIADGKRAGKSQAAIGDDLDAYRAIRAELRKAISAVRVLLMTGDALLPLYEAGTADASDVSKFMLDLFHASTEVTAAMNRIYGGR